MHGGNNALSLFQMHVKLIDLYEKYVVNNYMNIIEDNLVNNYINIIKNI